MHEVPIVTSVRVPDRGDTEMLAPLIISAEENADSLAIRDALLYDPRLGGADLRISHRDDNLVISGTVESDEQRVLALDLVGSQVESGKVIDEMEIGDQSPDFCEK